MAGTLYVVATPIGNLADLTFRAEATLKAVHFIAVEDTRTSRKLLAHYAIDTPLISYHDHNEIYRAKKIIDKLNNGDSIAIISDAGTPGISDPGYRVVNLANKLYKCCYYTWPLSGNCCIIYIWNSHRPFLF